MKKQFNLLSIIVSLVLVIFGIILIFIDVFVSNTQKIHLGGAWMSIGSSLLASGLVTLLNAILVERVIVNPLDDWGITKIYKTRSDKSEEADKELKNLKVQLDGVAFGLKSFRTTKSRAIENCLKRGVNIRLITMHPDSTFVAQREVEEGEVEGQIKKTITELIKWADTFNSKKYKGRITVKGYDSMTLDFYWRTDDVLYVGPYWYNYASQQTVTYKFTSGKKAFDLYTDYFETLWKNEELITLTK